MSIESNELRIAQIIKNQIDVDFEVNDEFKNYLKGLPSDISQTGLLQTVAFIKGKNDDKYERLYGLLDEFFNRYFHQTNLIQSLLNLNDMETYRHYQNGFITYASWLKRLVLALK